MLSNNPGPQYLKTEQITIPGLYLDIRERIDALSLDIAKIAEKEMPGGRFGMRAYIHMNELADRALEFGQAEGFSREECGLLMLILKSHDIGRNLAAIPYPGRALYVPFDKKEKFNVAENEAQHMHAELSFHFLRTTKVVSGLSADKAVIVETAVLAHAEARLFNPPIDPSFKFVRLARELDQIELLTRNDFTTDEGALSQFIQWGAPIYGFSKEAAHEVLHSSPKLNQTAKAFISSLLENSVNSRADETNQLKLLERDFPIAAAIRTWFDAEPDDAAWKPLKDYLSGLSGEKPYISKENNHMVKNYANYMLSHIYIGLQLESPAAVGAVLEKNSAFERRCKYLYTVIPHAVVDFKKYLKPLILEMRSKLNPERTVSAA